MNTNLQSDEAALVDVVGVKGEVEVSGRAVQGPEDLHQQLQHHQRLAADLVEGVTDRSDDGRHENLGVGVEDCGVVGAEQTLDEREGVDLHVTVALIIS